MTIEADLLQDDGLVESNGIVIEANQFVARKGIALSLKRLPRLQNFPVTVIRGILGISNL